MLIVATSLMVLLEYKLIATSPQSWTSQSILRMFGVTLVIMGALILVVSGYSDTQIAPVMGLLGTIVGYLLGQRGQPVDPTPAAPQPAAVGE